MQFLQNIFPRNGYRLNVGISKEDKETLDELKKKTGRPINCIIRVFLFLFAENPDMELLLHDDKDPISTKILFDVRTRKKLQYFAKLRNMSKIDLTSHVIHTWLKIVPIQTYIKIFGGCEDWITLISRSITNSNRQ